jgi:hypothetical protein
MASFGNFQVMEPESISRVLDLTDNPRRHGSALMCVAAVRTAVDGGGHRARGWRRFGSSVRHKSSPAREAGAMSLGAWSRATALAVMGRSE